MKKLIFLLCMILTAIAVQAQSAQVATLSHEGKISTYYSGNALKDAYNAAVDGDIITLSSGNFTCPSEIKKNITIRGAGMMPDEDPTILNGNVTFKELVNENHSLTLEGINHIGQCSFYNTQNVKLVKVWINTCDFNTGNGQFNRYFSVLHSIIGRITSLSMYNGTGSDLSILNSVIKGINDIHSYNPMSLLLKNCIVLDAKPAAIRNTAYQNCILIGSGTNDDGSTSSTYSNCYYFGPSTKPFQYSISNTNVLDNSLSADQVFEETLTYTLSAEHQKEWLGNDGTQVGVHGGTLPFDPTPTNPQITKFNVAPKTTADGKLSVDIEVKAN